MVFRTVLGIKPAGLIEQAKKEKLTFVGTGHRLGEPEDEEIDLVIPDSRRKGHCWCFGTTRVGKTRLMEAMVEQDIRKGFSTIVIDPKGDWALFKKIIQVAFEEGRQEDLIFITPIFPDYSAVFDPLAYYFMPEELVAHITSGVPVGEQFFYMVAYKISMILVQALLLKAKAEGRPLRISLMEVKDRMDREELAKLYKELQMIDASEARDVLKQVEELLDHPVGIVQEVARDMQKVINSPQQFYEKISESLHVALMQICSGNIGKLVGKAKENRLIQRLEEGKSVIMVAHLGALQTEDAAKVLGKVIISTVKAFVGRRFASGKDVNPPLAIYIDEAQNVLYKGIEDLLSKAGGAGVWVHGFNQSVNQIYQEVGKDFGRSILDNANTKIFMKVPDADTAQYVSRHFGMGIRFSPAVSLGGGIIAKETEDYLVKPEDVLYLAAREFYMFGYDGQFKGKTISVRDSYVQLVLPEIQPVDEVC